MKLLLLLVTMLLLGQPAPLSAQQLGAANQLELIQTLIARMEQLEKRVAELEGSRAQVAVTPTNEQSPILDW